MSDVYEEAEGLLQCKSCPWYKNCVMPMRVTEEDLRRQLETTMPGGSTSGPPYEISQFLATIASAAQNSLLEGCPVFIDRLRRNPKLAQEIKRLMQEWSRDEQL
ncbi:MAG: hypothetical protein ACOC58_00925 [Chloroflexota bacterium]